MKAAKYVYYVVGSCGKSPGYGITDREGARGLKRFIEKDNMDFNDERCYDIDLPLKIVRYAVNPTGEVIR